jgi:Ankyrin repeats (many copies)
LTALHLAAKDGHVEALAALLARGADVNAATKVSILEFRRERFRRVFVFENGCFFCVSIAA